MGEAMKMVIVKELVSFIGVVMDIVGDLVEIVMKKADEFGITFGVVPKEESEGEGRGGFDSNSVTRGKMEFKAISSDAN